MVIITFFSSPPPSPFHFVTLSLSLNRRRMPPRPRGYVTARKGEGEVWVKTPNILNNNYAIVSESPNFSLSKGKVKEAVARQPRDYFDIFFFLIVCT